MDEVIAVKSISIYIFFILGLIIAAIGALVAFLIPVDEAFLLLLLSFLGIGIAIYYAIAMRLPKNLIVKSGDSLILPKMTIKISDIRDVIYKRATARNANYSFGKIIFRLNAGDEVSVNHIAGVEEAGLQLSKLIYGGQNKK